MVMQAMSRRLIDASTWCRTRGLVAGTVDNGRIMHYVRSRRPRVDCPVTGPRIMTVILELCVYRTGEILLRICIKILLKDK